MYTLRSRPASMVYIEDDDDEDTSSQTTTTTTTTTATATTSQMSTSQEIEIDDDNNYNYSPNFNSSPMEIVEGGKKFYQRRCRGGGSRTSISQVEREILIEIVSRHKNLSPNTPHKTGLQLRRESWEKIAEEFYQRPEVTTRRSIEALKTCWNSRKAFEKKARRYKIVVQPGRTRNSGIEVQVDSSYAIRQNFHPEDTEVYTGQDNPPMCRFPLNVLNDFVGDPLRPMRQIVIAQALPNPNAYTNGNTIYYYQRKKTPLLSPFRNRSRCTHKSHAQVTKVTVTNEAIKPKKNEAEKTVENPVEQKRYQLFLKAQKDLQYLKGQMHNVKAVYTQRKSNSNSSSQSSN